MSIKICKPFISFKKNSQNNDSFNNEIKLIKINQELQFSIQNLKLSYQKLSEENQNKDNFLAVIAHEIRNQIAGIVSISDLIKTDSNNLSESEFNEYITLIYNTANEAMQFTDDLIDIKQSSINKFSVNMDKKIDISQVIERSIKINYGFSLKKKAQIKFDNETILSKIKLDPRRMMQILVNLISNALKYSKENSIITVSAQEEKISNNDDSKQLIISVKDQGVGMSNDDIAMALNGEGTEIVKFGFSREIESHGIGLPLVKQLVEIQKGKMEIESKINKGTEIKLKFFYSK